MKRKIKMQYLDLSGDGSSAKAVDLLGDRKVVQKIGVVNGRIAGLTLVGGDNTLCITDGRGWTFENMELGPPLGIPGSSDHPVAVRRSNGLVFRKIVCHCSGDLGNGKTKGASGDGMNFSGSWDCMVDGLSVDGKLWWDKKIDLARDLVVDKGSYKIGVFNSKLRTVTVADGRLGDGNEVTFNNCDLDELQIGDCYPGFDKRINVKLVNSRIGKLWIHSLTGSVVADGATIVKDLTDTGKRLIYK